MTMLYNSLPTLDLHGLDREYARILIQDFINDNYKLKNEKVIIVHGIGTGIIRKTTQETLRKNNLVESYKIDNFNDGMTIVQLKQKRWQIKVFMIKYLLHLKAGDFFMIKEYSNDKSRLDVR